MDTLSEDNEILALSFNKEDTIDLKDKLFLFKFHIKLKQEEIPSKSNEKDFLIGASKFISEYTTVNFLKMRKHRLVYIVAMQRNSNYTHSTELNIKNDLFTNNDTYRSVLGIYNIKNKKLRLDTGFLIDEFTFISDKFIKYPEKINVIDISNDLLD
jgi:hypothetical protein